MKVLVLKYFSYLLIILMGSLFFCSSPAFADDSEEDKSKVYNENASASALATCNLQSLKDMYIGEQGDEKQLKNCWYCHIVIMMTQAFLEAASKALSTSATLGKLILKWGLLIWLAYFFLNQLGSTAPLTPGKMLQEVLMMGFKCALSYYAITDGIAFIREYILEPIMITGTDIGKELLNKMLEDIHIVI